METSIINNNKIQLALSSIMFFAPLIKKEIKKNNINIKDKKFIETYIKYWNINIIILSIVIISWTLAYLLDNQKMNYIYEISLRILTISTVFGTLFIIKNLLIKKIW